MAWKPRLDHGPQGYQTYDVIDDSKEREALLCHQVAAQYAHLDRYDIMNPGIIKDMPTPMKVGMATGFRYPKPDRSFKIRMDRKTKWLADVTGGGVSFAFSQKIVDAIEAIEPGVHQYFPLDIFQPNGSLYPAQYWILNICHRVDSIALEHCDNVHPHYWSNTDRVLRYTSGDFYNTKYALWKDRIAGMAIWYEAKLGEILISDALKEALDAADATGWIFDEFGTPTYLHEI